MENLAPAGNREALERAVAAGADAVYLGCQAFSARAGAGNFSDEELAEAIRFAHLHHVRVHVAVNTLVKDEELPQCLAVLRMLQRLGADAVIVQDLGVVALMRQYVPQLPIHASTQMAIHHAAGCGWCARTGMDRVVLSRELPLSEIALCAREPIQVEVFAHGAQCVAVSGQCLFSSMLGDRSGNRGRCAQSCRMRYTYRGQTGAWLSPRDLCLRDDLPALHQAGVASIKIEGRLKSPTYVYETASSYRRGLDSLEKTKFLPAAPEEREGLLQVFHRGGFMGGHPLGEEDAAIIHPHRVNHGGILLGRVEQVAAGFARMRAEKPLHDGDGLQLRGRDGDREMIYAGKDVPAGSIALLRLRPGMEARAGDQVVRLTDASQTARAMAAPIPPIPVEMALTARIGCPLQLTITDGLSAVTVQGEEVEKAKGRPLTEEDARRSLGKTGDSPFILQELHVDTEDAFVPVSALNALRREGLNQLAERRMESFRLPLSPAWADTADRPLAPAPVDSAPPLPPFVQFRTPEQWLALQDTEDLRPLWFPEDFREEALEAMVKDLPQGVWFQLPMFCQEETLQGLHRWVHGHLDHLGGVVLGNVGQLGCNWELPFGGGTGIPVMNRHALALLLRERCEFATASPELTGKELHTLMEGGAPLYVPAYGRTQLMLLSHCPARTYLGLSKGRAHCTLCDRHDPDSLLGQCLTDRTGASFPLLRQRLPEGCMISLLNSLPLNVLSRVAERGYAPLITFTDEPLELVRQIGRALHGAPLALPATTGHWNRPVL